ncbi:MAG TPA: hypothetical protein VLA43_15300 [Longimicrobiales bacterium]|nr:hypothetical protein [Longimicrobiales bacterium]
MTTLSTAAQVALVLLGLLATLGVVVLVALLMQIRRLGRELNRQAGPLLERGKVVAANLEYISAQVRTDVERLNGSVKVLSERLNQASDRMEERIEEFNALMEVVQDEAEGMFLDTASTVRGLRAGAQHLAAPRKDLPPDEEAPQLKPPGSPRERSA